MNPKIFKVGGDEVRIAEVRLTKGTPFPTEESEDLKKLWALVGDPNNWEAVDSANGIEFRPVTPQHLSHEAPFGGPNVAHMVWKVSVSKGPISKETLNFTSRMSEWGGKTTGQPSSVILRPTASVEPTPSTAPLKQITKEDLAAALKLIQEWVPEERQTLETQKEAILSYVETQIKPGPGGTILKAPMESHTWSDGIVSSHMTIQADNPLRLLEFSSLKQEVSAAQVDKSACGEAVAWACVSTVWFFMGFVGFRGAKPTEQWTKAALIDAARQPRWGNVKQLFQNLSEAETLWEKGVQIFLVLKAVGNLGISWLIRTIRHQLSWYRWAGFSVLFVAQLTVWVLSDGLALIAQIVLTMASAVFLIGDYMAAHKKCTA